jgi:WD40 repeat protein
MKQPKFLFYPMLLVFHLFTFASVYGQQELEEGVTVLDTIFSSNTEAISISSNGQFLSVGGGDKKVHVFKLDSLGRLSLYHIFSHHRSTINTLMFNKDAKFLISGGKDFLMNIYQIDTPKLHYSFKDGTLPVVGGGMDFLPRVVYKITDDSKLHIFDLVDPKRNVSVLLDQEPTCIKMSYDRKFFFIGTQKGDVLICDIFGKVSRVFSGAHTGRINDIDVGLDGKTIVTAGSDKKAVLWNVANGKVLKEFKEGHQWKVNAVHLSLKGNYLLTGTNDGKVILWDLETGMMLKAFERIGQNIRDLTLSPNLKTAYVCSHLDDKNKGAIWMLDTGLSLPPPPPPPARPGAPSPPTKR